MFKMAWAYGLILLVLAPQFKSIKEIEFSETIDVNMENELFPKDHVESCGAQDAVNLLHFGLTKIPTHTIKSDKIRHVDLSFNSIEDIPNSFFRDVPNIECLNLTSNSYPPSKILWGSNSVSLKTLILDRSRDPQRDEYDRYGYRNSNEELSNPCQMTGTFPNLKTLHINEIKGCSIDASFKDRLPQLTTLYVMNYDSNTVSYNWSLPASVRHLHVEGTKFDALYADSLGDLQTLYLDGYSYVDDFNIPFDANDLRVVSCRHCSLTLTAIEKFFRVTRNALQILDLSNNNLYDLPKNMYAEAKSLESLILSNNHFTSMPEVQTLPRLRGLVLSHNKIYELAGMKSDSLKMLSLRDNNIRIVYNTTFQGLSALEVLDLSENGLTSLPTGWANSLKKIQKLILQSNFFARLADTGLVKATGNLTHLVLNGNPIERLTEQDFGLVPNNCTIYLTLGGKPFLRETSISDETSRPESLYNG